MSKDKKKLKMSSNHINNYIIGYLEKTLSPERQDEVEKHLSVCQNCKEMVQNIASVYFVNDPCPEISPYFYTRVEAKLSQKNERESLLPVSIIKSLRPVAAGLFLMTAITFGIFLGNYIIFSQQSKVSSNTNEDMYEYYISLNEDPVVSQIINNEK